MKNSNDLLAIVASVWLGAAHDPSVDANVNGSDLVDGLGPHMKEIFDALGYKTFEVTSHIFGFKVEVRARDEDHLNELMEQHDGPGCGYAFKEVNNG